MNERVRPLAIAALVAVACDTAATSATSGQQPSTDASGRETNGADAKAPPPVAGGSASALAPGDRPPVDAALELPAGGDDGAGKFVWKFVPAKKAAHKRYEALFEHGRLSSLVDVMGLVVLPRNIPVATLECGSPNAFYTNEKHGVVLCYELVHEFYTRFAASGVDDQTASNSTLNALTFVLLHEMGHAVVGEIGLGVTGGEEDAVDDLAALLLVDAGQPGWAVDGALSMAMLDAGNKPAYFDEHSIGEQRFYNIACIVFGSDPEKYLALVEKGALPRSRAVRCPKEHQQKNKAWEDLLGPHLRRK
jgi:hypothetical protein